MGTPVTGPPTPPLQDDKPSASGLHVLYLALFLDREERSCLLQRSAAVLTDSLLLDHDMRAYMYAPWKLNTDYACCNARVNPQHESVSANHVTLHYKPGIAALTGLPLGMPFDVLASAVVSDDRTEVGSALLPRHTHCRQTCFCCTLSVLQRQCVMLRRLC